MRSRGECLINDKHAVMARVFVWAACAGDATATPEMQTLPVLVPVQSAPSRVIAKDIHSRPDNLLHSGILMHQIKTLMSVHNLRVRLVRDTGNTANDGSLMFSFRFTNFWEDCINISFNGSHGTMELL